MVIVDFEMPVKKDFSTHPSPPKFRIKYVFGTVNGVDFISYGEGKNESQALKMAEQSWENYKKMHYGPGVTVETLRNGDGKYADKYKHTS